MTLVTTEIGAPAVTSPAPRVAWWAAYHADLTAVPSQSPAWVDAMVATGAWADASRHYRFPDGTEVVLPLVRRRSLGPTSLASMPDAWGYGGVLGAELDADRIGAVLADLRSLRCGWVRVRPNPLHAEAWAGDGPEGGASVLRVAKRAHVLELAGTPEDIFTGRFSSSCRRAVRSAEKAGITVEVDTTGASMGVFHDLLMCSVERWAGFQHEPAALARWRAARRDPLSKLRAWATALEGGCRVLVARRDGEAIAAMVVLQGHNAHMTRSAMDRDKVGSDRPNELLMWHAIRDAAESGCRSFHLGESGRSVSLSRYKEKFGAVPLDYPEVRVERLPATRVDAALRGGVKRLIGFEDA